MTPGACLECGAQFQSIRSTRRYCDQRCRGRHWGRSANGRRQDRALRLTEKYKQYRSSLRRTEKYKSYQRSYQRAYAHTEQCKAWRRAYQRSGGSRAARAAYKRTRPAAYSAFRWRYGPLPEWLLAALWMRRLFLRQQAA